MRKEEDIRERIILLFSLLITLVTIQSFATGVTTGIIARIRYEQATENPDRARD